MSEGEGARLRLPGVRRTGARDRVREWQRRVEPVWKRLAGGCHLTRPVGGTIRGAGLAIARLESMYLPKAPRMLGWNEWGEARPG